METCILVGSEWNHTDVLALIFFYRILVTLDRAMSQNLGRPCGIQDEECAHIAYYYFFTDLMEYLSSFDLEFPMECDDEYWVDPDPEKAFKQPPGKPSKISFFTSYLKLNQILGFALRTIASRPLAVSTKCSLRYYSIPSTSPKFGSVSLDSSGSSI